MKIEFKNSANKIKSGEIFFLYGNYKKTFDVFCDFVSEQLKKNNSEVKTKNFTFVEYEKFQKFSQCDLFSNCITCFCIRGVEDKHLEKIKNFPRKNNVFILESGEYFKSKKITDAFTKDKEILSLASFNNNLTLVSLLHLLLPNLDSGIYNEIIKIINETDESLRSLFRKLSLLLDQQNFSDLREYITYKKSFLDDFDFIPLIRYLLQASIKENIFHQDQSYIKMNLKNKIRFLMEAELKQKMNYPLNKNYLYQNLVIKN